MDEVKYSTQSAACDHYLQAFLLTQRVLSLTANLHSTAMLRLLLLLCFLGLPCSALQLGVVTPARLSEAARLAAGNQTAHSQCTRDFSRWMAALSSGERWALEMADSWTKSVTGVLHGNQYDLGDFDECIYASSASGQQTSSSAPVIRGAYLLPAVSIISTNKSAVLSRPAQVLLQVSPLQLQVSLCVPDSCGQDLLLDALRLVAKDLLSEEGLSDAFRVSISLPANKVQTEANAFKPGWQHWAYLSAVAVLVLLAVISTILDNKLDSSDSKDARRRWRHLLHFSLSSGMRRLLAPAPPGSMTCINGIRVMATIWIMAGHTFQFHAPQMNSLDVENFMAAPLSRMLWRYGLSVDTFLTVAGIVCCISFMRAANKTNSFNWVKYIIHRYARTTPAVIFVTLYGATWMRVSSPGADVLNERPTSHWYEEYWWTSFLHISNFFADLTSNVMPHTWYLSMDMQMYVLAPVVLIPLWKSALVGKIVLAFATLAACLIPGVLSIIYKMKTPDPPEGGKSPDLYELLKMLNFGTESRMSPYVVGIATGYFLYQIKYGGSKVQVNRLHAAGMWLLIAALLNTVVFAPHSIESSSHPYNAVESFFFVGFLKLAWGVAISLLIIACETGWGGPVNKILSLRAFSPLGKLSFTIYLVHFFILNVDMLYVVHSLEYYSFYVFVRKVISSVMLTVPLAAFVHLTVEQPLVLLETDLWK